MKRFSLLCVLAILCSLPAYSQFWISLGGMNRIVKIVFGWSKRCICPLAKQAEYHKIIHKYGQK